MKKHIVEKWVMALLFIFAVIVPCGFIIMVLWNIILVPVLQEGAVRPIGFWQALGLLLLFRLLLGGVPSGWWKKDNRSHAFRDKQVLEKWKEMSSEEKAQFRQEWQKHLEKDSISKDKSEK